MRDFTLSKYEELCKSLLSNEYSILNLEDYLGRKKNNERPYFALLRHDIDNKTDHKYVLQMAQLENDLGISTTYYIRTIDSVYSTSLVEELKKLGHEIGYHYEVMNTTNDNINEAKIEFKKNLRKIRNDYPVSTVVQHGGVLGEQSSGTFFGLIKIALSVLFQNKEFQVIDNLKFWDHNSFEDFDLLGDGYHSIDFNKLYYFSDTGLKWDAFEKRALDVVDADYYTEAGSLATTTDDLIDVINSRKLKKIYILVHPGNWREGIISWSKWHLLQWLRNFGKSLLILNGNET